MDLAAGLDPSAAADRRRGSAFGSSVDARGTAPSAGPGPGLRRLVLPVSWPVSWPVSGRLRAGRSLRARSCRPSAGGGPGRAWRSRRGWRRRAGSAPSRPAGRPRRRASRRRRRCRRVGRRLPCPGRGRRAGGVAGRSWWWCRWCRRRWSHPRCDPPSPAVFAGESSVAGRRVRGLVLGPFGRGLVRVLGCRRPRAGLPRRPRRARCPLGGLGRLRSPRAPPWTNRLAASGPGARGGRAARAGSPAPVRSPVGDRFGDGCRRRCGRGRRSLPSLSRAGARSRDRLPAAKLARASAAGSSAGMSPPVGSVAVGAATSSLLIRTPFAWSRGRAGRDRRTPDRGANPMRVRWYRCAPGLGACGPCAGPRARSRTRNVLVRRLRSLGPRLAAGVPRGRPDEVRAPCRSLASAVPGEQVWTKDSSRPASDPQAGRSGAGKMVSHKGLRGSGVAPP